MTHRQEILSFLKAQPFNKSAEVGFMNWLIDRVFIDAPYESYVNEVATLWFRESFNNPNWLFIICSWE